MILQLLYYHITFTTPQAYQLYHNATFQQSDWLIGNLFAQGSSYRLLQASCNARSKPEINAQSNSRLVTCLIVASFDRPLQRTLQNPVLSLDAKSI